MKKIRAWLIKKILSDSEKELMKDSLSAQIGALRELTYTTAYQGSLDELKASTYVRYSEVVFLIHEKRRLLNKLK